MSRDPFQMIGSCVDLHVSVPALADMLFCTTPILTSPTYAVPSPFILSPDVAPPDDCICLSIAMDVSGRITGKSVKGTGHFTNDSSDCCLPEPRIVINYDIPCMPLTASASASIQIQDDIPEPLIQVKLTKLPSCEMKFTMHLDIPCMPLTASAYGLISIRDTTAEPSMHVGLVKLKDCELQFTMRLDIPCTPFSIDSTASISIDIDRTEPSMHITVTRLEDCQFVVDVDVGMPCMPITAVAAARITIDNHRSKPSVHIQLRKKPECELSLTMAIDIPCMPLTINGTHQISVLELDEPVLNVAINKRPDDCALTYNIEIAVPCIPFGLTVMEAGQAAGFVAWDADPVVSVSVRLTRPTACELAAYGNVYVGIPNFGAGPDSVRNLQIEQANMRLVNCLIQPRFTQWLSRTDLGHVLKTDFDTPPPFCCAEEQLAGVLELSQQYEPQNQGASLDVDVQLTQDEDTCCWHLTGLVTLKLPIYMLASDYPKMAETIQVVTDVYIEGSELKMKKRDVRLVSFGYDTAYPIAGLTVCS